MVKVPDTCLGQEYQFNGPWAVLLILIILEVLLTLYVLFLMCR